MKNSILLILFLTSFKLVYSFEDISQDSSKIYSFDKSLNRQKNNINANVLRNASIISVQYERFFFINNKISVAFGLGVGESESFSLFSDNVDYYLTIPLHLTFNILRREKNYFLFGLGCTIIEGENVNQHYYIIPMLGYRWRLSKNFNLGPFIGYPINPTDEILIIPLGFSIGVCF